ncbi:hypothetical protein CS022_05860 [Veronia nyctiphanis]|uniref:VWFA domain-containing protein n=1 Tax=Veronia nyctiphanis TaxID=1278244 RepID=A0A4Q0YYJ3_9GAMM|nr:VWA domain-containing protein [Veronia nyctiphanis]RXJ74141.1 hypothetical protein CS022_05860 [Veronia nyctiphanis]
MMNNTPKFFCLSLTVLALTACTSENDTTNATKTTQPEPHEVIDVVSDENKKGDTKLPQTPKDKKLMVLHYESVDQMSTMAIQTTRVGIPQPMPPIIIEPPTSSSDRDNYLPTPSNGVFQTSVSPLSTFSVDVDTGSYANVRSYLKMGKKPPKDAVREEAFINYFDYQYPAPSNKKQPFSLYTEVAPAPWHADRQLLRLTLKGYDIPANERKPSNLVFLIDVSGSMNEANKLPLLTQSLTLMVNQLSEEDFVSIVTYAGATRLALEPTSAKNKTKILNTLKSLKAAGSTNGEGGIQLAYQQALDAKIKNGVNRVILATDGDFNVGTTNIDALKSIIEEKRKQGISLTTLGFGRGNYNDAMMEQLADIGDGNHAYIDTLHEAQKVLQRQLSGTVQSIASDVKIQIEFNPATVKEYRLIGYTNRLLKDEDFNNDAVDAGEIGAGHVVTALYEMTLAGKAGQIDDLKYQQTKQSKENNGELLEVKVRYKLPGESTSKLVKTQVTPDQITQSFDKASDDFRFASAVAAFAQKLKANQYLTTMNYTEIADIARKSRGEDPFNYRGEFVSLVELAPTL